MKESTLYTRINQIAANNSQRINLALKLMDTRNQLETMLAAQRNIISNTTIVALTLLFVLFATGETLLSWEIYRDLASQFQLEPSGFLIAFFALIIVAIAILSSWLLETRISSSLRQWIATTKKKHHPYYADFPISEIEKDVVIEHRERILAGYALAFILLVLVGYLSYQREVIMAQLVPVGISELGMITEGREVDYANVILPPLLVLLEIICGVYLIVGLQKLFLYVRYRSVNARYKKQLKNCRDEDLTVSELVQYLFNQGYPLLLNADIEDALYRAKNRSLTNSDYLAPVLAGSSVTVPHSIGTDT